MEWALLSDFQSPLGQQALSTYRLSRDEADKLTDSVARSDARLSLSRARKDIYLDFSRLNLLRALKANAGASEPLAWFWFNHFNVFWQKDIVGVALPSYVDEVIRPGVLGRFRDLLLATMTHPAMLVYLDNVRNVAGRINENYARELLELHTLGVDGGYGQADVQEVARLLTGFGLRPLREVKWSPRHLAQKYQQGEFLFDPRRHDFGEKRVLGHTIGGKGYTEAEVLADILARHPSTARHLAGKLCLYLAGEGVPQTLVDQATEVFKETDGDLGKVVANIQQADGNSGVGRRRTFKDPYRWLLSAVGLLAAGHPVKDARQIEGWLNALGQPLFGCRTPDGYSLKGTDWASAGQLTQRFELARDIVQASRRLLDQPLSAEAVLATASVRALVATFGSPTRAALDKTDNAEERLALLLSSPEFMYW